jgi:hypothetical protein
VVASSGRTILSGLVGLVRWSFEPCDRERGSAYFRLWI